ncbi:MAG TPA: barstar family protein [Sphingomicrobium sp.]
MKVMLLDASEWRSQENFYSTLLPELGWPDWYGRNLDAFDSAGGEGIA